MSTIQGRTVNKEELEVKVKEMYREVSDQATSYLLAGQPSELERLQVQSRVWEPSGQSLLTQLPGGSGLSAVDIGCGVMGWLRILSQWVGPSGQVVGSDIDEKMLAAAQDFVDQEGLSNVTLLKDDLFETRLSPQSFDLVHARYEITPLGRAEQQLAVYHRLVKPGGWIVLEEPDTASWRINPSGLAAQRLIDLIVQAFSAAGGNFNAGRELPSLLRTLGVEPTINAHVIALPPGHPYLRLPLQFAKSMEARLATLIGGHQLGELLLEVEKEINEPETWGTTFTLIQAFASLPL